MKLLLALLLVASLQSWGVKSINLYEAVIVNELDRSIICYVYYDDGDFKKLYVRAHSESRPFISQGISEVECY